MNKFTFACLLGVVASVRITEDTAPDTAPDTATDAAPDTITDPNLDTAVDVASDTSAMDMTNQPCYSLDNAGRIETCGEDPCANAGDDYTSPEFAACTNAENMQRYGTCVGEFYMNPPKALKDCWTEHYGPMPEMDDSMPEDTTSGEWVNPCLDLENAATAHCGSNPCDAVQEGAEKEECYASQSVVDYHNCTGAIFMNPPADLQDCWNNM